MPQAKPPRAPAPPQVARILAAVAIPVAAPQRLRAPALFGLKIHFPQALRVQAMAAITGIGPAATLLRIAAPLRTNRQPSPACISTIFRMPAKHSLSQRARCSTPTFTSTRLTRPRKSCSNGLMATPGNIVLTGAPTILLTESMAQTAAVLWVHCQPLVNGCAWKFRPARWGLKAPPSKAWASRPLMVAPHGTPAAKQLLVHPAAAQQRRQLPAEAAVQSPAPHGWMIPFLQAAALEVMAAIPGTGSAA